MWAAFEDWFHLHYALLKDFAGSTVSLLAVVATFVIAWIGLSTFERWRRQKIEERWIDIAIRALAAVYKARFVFDNIRSPMAFAYEWDEMPQFAGDTDNKRRSRGNFFAVLKSIQMHK